MGQPSVNPYLMEIYKVFQEQLALIFTGILHLLGVCIWSILNSLCLKVYCVYSEVDLKLVLST